MKALTKIRLALLSLFGQYDAECSAIEEMSPGEFRAKAEPLKVGREVPRALILFEYGSPLVRKAGLGAVALPARMRRLGRRL